MAPGCSLMALIVGMRSALVAWGNTGHIVIRDQSDASSRPSVLICFLPSIDKALPP